MILKCDLRVVCLCNANSAICEMRTVIERVSDLRAFSPEAYSEPSRTSKMELFVKISILDVRLGSDYASGIYLNCLSRNCKTISANKVFSKYTVTKLSASNSKPKSVTKLKVHFCENDIFKEFFYSCKKYFWKMFSDNLLKFFDILIGNASFRQLIIQL